jgi:hypothetical protein
MDPVENYPNVVYRNERRQAMIDFHKSMKLWKKKKPTLPLDVWMDICDKARELFMDEWDAKGRALGLLP